MNELLLEVIKELQSNKRMISFDEVATKQAIILRILSCLGWEQFNIDEVYPEYSVHGKRVDYALRHHNKNKVFIEVKKVGEELEKHQEQLLNYSFQEGVKLAILTNGITWWFYLPLIEGSWEQRKFYTIEIYEQNVEEITQKFVEFLYKQNVTSGKSIENAEKVYTSKQKQHTIKNTLPKAWRKITEGPAETLIELIADTTEKLCGYRPEGKDISSFLKMEVVAPAKSIKLPQTTIVRKATTYRDSQGNITPQIQYCIPILESLVELGGTGKTDDVLQKVYEKMKNILTSIDYEKISSGEHRWRNHARWERKNMVGEGLLRSDSIRGVWEITEKGKKYLVD